MGEAVSPLQSWALAAGAQASAASAIASAAGRPDVTHRVGALRDRPTSAVPRDIAAD